MDNSLNMSDTDNSKKLVLESQTTNGLDEPETGNTILKLSSKSQKGSQGARVFEVSKKASSISLTISTALESDKAETEIELDQPEEILELLVEYMNHHDGKEPPIIPFPITKPEMKLMCEDQWDASFIDRVGQKKKRLYKLLLGFNYLQMNVGVHLCCAKIATFIKGKPLEQVKIELTTDRDS